jgi:hypothetical protein
MARQIVEVQRIELIDQWGQGLTILMVVTGVPLWAFYLYLGSASFSQVGFPHPGQRD